MPRQMPPFDKSPAALVERFGAVAARHPDAQARKMFGYPALFVGGNYGAGLFADRVVVRLSSEDLESALATAGAEPFSPMPGRAMAGWAALPANVVSDDAALDVWIGRGLRFAASLPPKASFR